ncbi:unnamed protein product (macronuclear) [Paramecium tetraurelia]|uniref:EGF-like domain-containing protein n=1 Tax=Paramecium tetraurelia TaxID=5888 RepID=A0C7W7_PARTE|nr:uncharacterized protein GSPATT00036015001 [Paramecium tetraurelia]CAK66884.1 unnamed protein product [Paramecium tetraurelia]|eukprot:XP_001434281.1 hypothetical protein (macronuclear) [Paramecium tetraurelia strain d4-2]
MQFLVLSVFIMKIHCGWELYISELMDSSTFYLWKNSNNIPSSNLLLVCDLQPALNSKILQGDLSLTRIISMSATRGFSKIRISFDIYYLGQWNIAEAITVYANSLLVHYETPKTYILEDFPMRYCVQRPFGKSTSEKISRIDQIISFNDPQLNIEIVHEQVTSGSTSDYGITNFVLQVFYCDDLCEECDEYQCLTCKLGYELVQQQCRCNPTSKFSYFNPNLQCLDECPINHVPDQNGICQLATITNIYVDLEQDNFGTYKFQFIPDKYYSTVQLMVQTIGTKSVAGMFGNTDKIVYNDILLPANEKYEMKFTLYMTGRFSSQFPEEILISFNKFVVAKIDDFHTAFLYSYFKQGYRALPKEICNSAQFQTCKSYSISIMFDLSETVSEIEFSSKYALYKSSRKWGIRDFVVNKYSIPSSSMNCLNNCLTCEFKTPDICLSCGSSKNLFKGMCIDQCPDYTSAVSNVCVDSQMVNLNQEYLVNMFHDLNPYYLESYANKLSMKSYSYFMNKIILGGLGIWSNEQVIHRLKNKKPFYRIKVEFMLVFIDSKNNQIQFRTSVNTEISTYSMFGSGISVGNQVGQNEIEVIQSVSYTKSFQSTDELSVQLHCIRNIDSEAYCGIYDYRIIIWTCQDYCLECDDNGNCLNSINTQSTDINGCKSGYYKNINGECTICDIGCSTCTGYQDCVTCKAGYELRNKICYCSILKDVVEYCSQSNCFHNCQTCLNDRVDVGVIRPKHPKNCLSCDESKNLWLNVNQCTCLDGYYMENFSCYICYPTCRKCQDRARDCLACIPGQNRVLESSSCECQTGYFQEDNDLVCSKCSDLCLECNFTKDQCSQCYPAHYRTPTNDTCICMDGYYDVGQLICQKCPSTCKTCFDAHTCTSCYDDQYRIMSINNSTCTCKSGYFQQSSDVCGQCHLSCLECSNNTSQSCTRCPSTREPQITNNTLQFSCKCRRGYYESNDKQCLSCQDYINPPVTHYCYSKCGDGILQWNEDCDDGNNNYRDNCYKCLNGNSFCLDYTCTSCDAGRCSGCIDGFYLTQEFICLPCDPSCKTCVNRSDNCTDCMVYQSDGSGCVMCNQEQGYQVQGDQCVNICGDGIKVKNEQCDDGNVDNNDGCNHSCQVEDGYQCQTLCEKILYPSILFELNPQDVKYNSQRTVRIKTDQLVSISGSINSIMKFKINNLNQYDITFVDLTQYSDQYSHLFLELNIQLQSVVSNPQLICQIINQDAIKNQQGNSFEHKNYVTSLLEFQTPSNSTESATDGLIKLSRYILYLLLGFAILAFLFGGLNIFWNLLDVLQLVSYLQFLNVEYPYNVKNYFTIFGFAQFDFLKQYIDLEQYISQYVNTPDADPKFRNEGYSTVFYVNIITVLTVFITTLVTFIACRMLFSTLTKISHSFIYAPIDSQEQSVCTFFIYRITRNLQQSLLKINQEFMSGVIRTFMAVAFDYNLALFLQLKDVYLRDQILFSSFVFCTIALLLELGFIYSSILFMSKPDYVFKQKVIQNNLGAIYEGVKLEKNPFTYYFNIIILIKKMLFMMFLVLFYTIPCIQIGLVSMLNMGMAAYLIKVKPLDDKDELIKQVGSELIIWLAEMFILGFAINQQTNQLEENGKLNLGWFVIASTSSLILFQLIIDVKQHMNFLIHEYAVIKKLIDRIGLLIQRQEPEEEQNIFLQGKRRLGFENTTSLNNLNSAKNNRSSSHFKQGRVITFTVSSSSS